MLYAGKRYSSVKTFGMSEIFALVYPYLWHPPSSSPPRVEAWQEPGRLRCYSRTLSGLSRTL